MKTNPSSSHLRYDAGRLALFINVFVRVPKRQRAARRS
jgi:hypothetical protein